MHSAWKKVSWLPDPPGMLQGSAPVLLATTAWRRYITTAIHSIQNFEEMTGQATGWHGCGGLRFATTKEELDWFRYVESISRNIGFRMQIVSPEECLKINPFVDVTGVVAGAWTLDDGHVDPSGCCNALAIGARKMGADIIRGNRVTDIQLRPGGEWEVVTEQNMASIDPRRFGSYADKAYNLAKGHEVYSEMFVLQLPGEERAAGRPARTTPLYDKLKAKGAVYTEAFGWERPKWFSLDGREEECGFRHNNVFEVVAAECKAVRERVAVLELSSFSKYEVRGADAEKFLNRVCANRMPLRDGRIVLAHLLTKHGRIENEFTITRLADDHFYLLSAAVSELRDFDLLNNRILETENVTVTNISDDWGVLVLAGPRSREVLAKVTHADLRNEQFRWLTAQAIEVAGIELRALRLNYVGELGWELHVPMNQLEPLYDAIWSAGESFGIADFGVYAVNSLRMEKAYRAYGSELTTEITMIDADMERFVKFEKEHFAGKEALLKRKAEGSDFQLIYAQVASSDSDIRGGEPVLDGESVIGVTTSGAYGHTVGKQLIFAYVKPVNGMSNSTFDIEILGKRYHAEVLSEPIFDPKNERLRS